MKEVVRHDLATILDQDLPSEVLPNGFLPVKANLTRTGIFTYFEMTPDGTIKVQRQLRHPDEVFSPETMATLQGLPATNDHPPVSLVTPANAKDFVVGWQAENPRRVYMPEATHDGADEYVQTKVVFFDPKTIEQIRTGKKKEISLGYTCMLDESPGEWNGQPYDAIQRNIKYNHLSLVDKARGGPSCRIVNDSVQRNPLVDGGYIVEDTSMLDQATLDSMQSELKTLKELNERLKAERDEASDKLKAALFHDADSFKEAVKRRVELELKAQGILGKEVCLADDSERSIKEKVIKALRPEINLEDRSDEYLSARFEIALEDSQKARVRKSSEAVIGKTIVDSNGGAQGWQTVFEEAKKKAQDVARNAYKA